jgi:hypothetical protein
MILEQERQRLYDLRRDVRDTALDRLIRACELGQIPCASPTGAVNMHCHTFFSYNGYGHSPSSLALLAKQSGWHAVGMVDFDVLDHVQECLSACERCEVRGAAGMETRTFLSAYADREINSPGEPGVFYHIGMGFVSADAPPAAAAVLADMRQRASNRNRALVERINDYLQPVRIDYDADVLPLTPAGNATERHILVAYDRAARDFFAPRSALLRFWAGKLETDIATVDAMLGEEPYPHDLMRAKLMKQGGIGYVQPDADTFPPFDVVNQAIVACGAVPVCAWLDGTSAGESDMESLLGMLVAKGAAAINIVPDRNWNIADPAARAVKVRELHEVIELARAMDLPILVGTEMNKPGQKVVDDLGVDALRPYRRDFLRGADWIYGHTLMQQAKGLGYQSEWARQHLADRKARNAFYAAVGAGAAPDEMTRARVAQVEVAEPARILRQLNLGAVAG